MCRDFIVANFELECPNSTELDLERKCGEMSSDVLEPLVCIKTYRIKGQVESIELIFDLLLAIFFTHYK